MFVYYVGHGAPDPVNGDAYLIPADADPDAIAETAFPLSTFYAALRKLEARELIVVMDTCFSGRTPHGLLVKNVSPAMLEVRETPDKLKQAAVMTSAANDQLSTWYRKNRHSMYTCYFLKELGGEADANKDRRITTGEMHDPLARFVPFTAGRVANLDQTPKFKGRQDIVLAVLR